MSPKEGQGYHPNFLMKNLSKRVKFHQEKRKELNWCLNNDRITNLVRQRAKARSILTDQIDKQKDLEEKKLLRSNRKVLKNLFSETARDFGELIGGPKPYNSKTMGILASAFLDYTPSTS